LKILTAVAFLFSTLPVSAQTAPPGTTRPQPASQSTTQKPGTGQISGRVIAGDTGRPIPGAQVRVVLPGGPNNTRTAVTDDRGVYTITELPAGRVTVSASRNGYVTLAFGQRRPGASSHVSEFF